MPKKIEARSTAARAVMVGMFSIPPYPALVGVDPEGSLPAGWRSLENIQKIILKI